MTSVGREATFAERDGVELVFANEEPHPRVSVLRRTAAGPVAVQHIDMLAHALEGTHLDAETSVHGLAGLAMHLVRRRRFITRPINTRLLAITVVHTIGLESFITRPINKRLLSTTVVHTTERGARAGRRGARAVAATEHARATVICYTPANSAHIERNEQHSRNSSTSANHCTFGPPPLMPPGAPCMSHSGNRA